MIANEHNYDFKLNEYQQERFVKKIVDTLRSENGNTVAIWGFAFKLNMDDVRNSSTLKVMRRLDGEDYIIKTYDHKDKESAKKDLQLLNNEYVNNIFFITIPTKLLKESMS